MLSVVTNLPTLMKYCPINQVRQPMKRASPPAHPSLFLSYEGPRTARGRSAGCSPHGQTRPMINKKVPLPKFGKSTFFVVRQSHGRGTMPHNSTFPAKRLCVGLTSLHTIGMRLYTFYHRCRRLSSGYPQFYAQNFQQQRNATVSPQERERRGARVHGGVAQLVARRRRACPSPPCYKIDLFCWVGVAAGRLCHPAYFGVSLSRAVFRRPQQNKAFCIIGRHSPCAHCAFVSAPVVGRSAWLALRVSHVGFRGLSPRWRAATARNVAASGNGALWSVKVLA